MSHFDTHIEDQELLELLPRLCWQHHVFPQLSAADLARLSCTCAAFRNLVHEPGAVNWKTVACKHMGLADGRGLLADASSEQAKLELQRYGQACRNVGKESPTCAKELQVAVRDLTLSADGQLCAAMRKGSVPGVCILSMASGSRVALLQVYEDFQRAEVLGFAESDTRLVVAGLSNEPGADRCDIIDIASGDILFSKSWPEGCIVTPRRVSPSCKYVIVRVLPGSRYELLDTSSYSVQPVSHNLFGAVWSLAEQCFVLSRERDLTLYTFDPSSQSLSSLSRLKLMDEAFMGTATPVSISPNGGFFVALFRPAGRGAAADFLGIFDIHNPRHPKEVLAPHGPKTGTVQFSDEDLTMYHVADARFAIWDMQALTRTFMLELADFIPMPGTVMNVCHAMAPSCKLLGAHGLTSSQDELGIMPLLSGRVLQVYGELPCSYTRVIRTANPGQRFAMLSLWYAGATWSSSQYSLVIPCDTRLLFFGFAPT